MKVFFHSNQYSLRGTEVAMFDYAYHNEKKLGNKSIIITPAEAKNDITVKEKFSKHFELYEYKSKEELEDIVKSTHADVFYAIKAGFNDGIFVRGVHNCIHAVFKHYEPHGDVYAYVSEWLSKDQSMGKAVWVPHMIDLVPFNGNFRAELGIPEDALVFGRYGGEDSFDIEFVHEVIYDILKKNNNIYFIFMNTNEFSCPKKSNWIDAIVDKFKSSDSKRLIFLKGTQKSEDKTKFIQTCDAMLHARQRGETFGLAIGEFSSLNKPIFTYSLSPERSHLDILGDKGILYSNKKELINKITHFKPNQENLFFDCYSESFNPKNVINKFERVFLS